MARRKLPFEIVAQTIRDHDAFARATTTLARKSFDPDKALREAMERNERHMAEIMAEITPLPELLEQQRKQLVADLRCEQQKRSGGAPKKADPAKVRAFVEATTTPKGKEPSAFTKRRACKEFGVSQRTLRRILTGRP